MSDIIINNKKFFYQIIRKPIASIRLSLKSPTKILITCPRLTPGFIIKKFIQSNSDWIIKHAPKFVTPSKLSSLQKINILGNEYQLLVNKTPRDSVIILEDEHKIFVNSSNFTNAYLKNIFEKRLKRLSLVLIKTEIEKIKKEHPFKCRSVSVRNQKTRFGSCSSVGSLNFNWQIIFFSPNIFRHILFHELVHLKVKNHSRQFWETLGIYDPDWKINNLWLKKEGSKYFIIKP